MSEYIETYVYRHILDKFISFFVFTNSLINIHGGFVVDIHGGFGMNSGPLFPIFIFLEEDPFVNH